MEEEWNIIELKNWDSKTSSRCLESGVGGNQVHLGTFAPNEDKVFYQGKKTVKNWGLFPVGGTFEPLVIAPNVLSASGYVRRNVLNKERFHLLDCTSDLWMQIND